MPKFDVLVSRFPFGAVDHPDTTDWLVQTAMKMKSDPRIGEVHHCKVDDTPITMSRNRVLKTALQIGVDFVLMLDSDMAPDLKVPGAKPFWDTTFDFMVQHDGPCMVGAPYCGPPPLSNVYVFRWASWNNKDVYADADWRLEQFSREEAARLTGIGPVDALPTGLCVIDMRAIEILPKPWFDYEWKDPEQTEKASTEDVMFSRNLKLKGIPLYCNWDAWAGHWKRVCVGKPQPLMAEDVDKEYRKAAERNKSRNIKVMEVQPDPRLRQVQKAAKDRFARQPQEAQKPNGRLIEIPSEHEVD